MAEGAAFCAKCGVGAARKTVATPSVDDNLAIRMLIPVGRSGWAIAAGYLGLLSPIPLIGTLALALGIVAIIDIKKHPKKHGLGRAWFGAIAGGIFTLLHLIGFSLASAGR